MPICHSKKQLLTENNYIIGTHIASNESMTYVAQNCSNLHINCSSVHKSEESKPVINSILRASNKTGIDFNYLLLQAKAESSLNPEVKSSTSSATGLYQFIESTWLSMIKKHGEKHGLKEYVELIDQNGNITDPKNRKTVLDLRYDPEISSLLAAELASENNSYLSQRVDGDIGATELYLSHFMGAAGATKFLNAMNENPRTIGSEIFAKEAKANKNVFFDPQTGNARTLKEIYDFFDKKFTIAKSNTPIESTTDNTKSYRNHGFVPLPDSYKNPTPINSLASFILAPQDIYFLMHLAQNNSDSAEKEKEESENYA